MTSPEPRAVAEEFYAALGRGDEPEAVAALAAEDVAWEVPGDVEVAPWVGSRRGREGVVEWLRLLRAGTETISFEVDAFVADDRVALSTGRLVMRLTSNGEVVDTPFAARFEVEDGLLRGYRFLEDSHQLSVAARR